MSDRPATYGDGVGAAIIAVLFLIMAGVAGGVIGGCHAHDSANEAWQRAAVAHGAAEFVKDDKSFYVDFRWKDDERTER